MDQLKVFNNKVAHIWDVFSIRQEQEVILFLNFAETVTGNLLQACQPSIEKEKLPLCL